MILWVTWLHLNVALGENCDTKGDKPYFLWKGGGSMPKILFKRGKEANLPDLGAGEPGFTTDTNKIFIGTDGENIQLANQKDVDAISTVVTDMTKPIDGGLFTDTNTDTPIDGGGF